MEVVDDRFADDRYTFKPPNYSLFFVENAVVFKAIYQRL